MKGVSEYRGNVELVKLVNDRKRVRLVMGSTILTYDKMWLRTHDRAKREFMNLAKMHNAHPVAYFCPHGDGSSFLNDMGSSVKSLVCPNQVGKTTHMIVDLILSAIPCNPDWWIFTRHGIEYREWGGPIKINIASSTFEIVRTTISEELMKWLPRGELGAYDPNLVDAKQVSWRFAPVLPLACGSEFHFSAYEQKQMAFESKRRDIYAWDEQPHEYQFDGADERLRTRDGRHVIGYTPHAIEGRPETSEDTWLDDMVTGKSSKGHTTAVYNITVPDVPDWIYPLEQKYAAYEKHVAEPRKKRNFRAMAEGEARYYGRRKSLSGKIFDEWQEKKHVIKAFEIPDTWTRYRVIDHGTKNPTACLWAAVNPEGFVVCYNEYYEAGLTVYENARNIVKLSGNELVQDGGRIRLAQSNMGMDRYKERFVKETYKCTVMDSRSRNTTDALSCMTLGDLYRMAGIRTIPASGAKAVDGIPFVRQYMHIEDNVVNPFTGETGSPRLFVLNTCRFLIDEIQKYVGETFGTKRAALMNNPKETARKKNDHLIDCLLYLLQIPPRYYPGRWGFWSVTVDEMEEMARHRKTERRRYAFVRDSITGY